MPKRSLLLLLLLCVPAIPSAAGVAPLGEARVVADVPDEEYFFYSPDSAALGGEFVVTWNSSFTRYDGSALIDWGSAVHGRRIAADGRPAGEPLALVPEEPKTDLGSSAVAADPAGRFAVVWDRAGEGHPHLDVALRRFSAHGAESSTVLLDRFGRNYFTLPAEAVAIGAFGRAVAVWGQPKPAGQALAGLFGQILLPSGQPLLPRFRITARPVPDAPPAVGTDAQGRTLVAYQSLERERSAVFLRTYDRGGRALTGEVRLAGAASEISPALAVHPDGHFVVAWTEATGIRAQLFDPSLRPAGPAIAVSGRPSAPAGFPDVALGPDGQFLVAWGEGEGIPSRIMARAFGRSGSPLGAPFRVDRDLPSNLGLRGGQGPTVAASANGTFLVSWVRGAPDTARLQIVSRLYGTGAAAEEP